MGTYSYAGELNGYPLYEQEGPKENEAGRLLYANTSGCWVFTETREEAGRCNAAETNRFGHNRLDIAIVVPGECRFFDALSLHLLPQWIIIIACFVQGPGTHVLARNGATPCRTGVPLQALQWRDGGVGAARYAAGAARGARLPIHCLPSRRGSTHKRMMMI